MNLAFLVGLKRPINPKTTASRNRIVANLASGLVGRGHQVSIFGTGDSNLPGVRFIEVVPKGLNFLPSTENPFYTETAYIVHAVAELIRRQGEFELIHNHMYPEFVPLLAQQSFKVPIVTTIHAPLTDEIRLAFEDTMGSSEIICLSNSAKRILNLKSDVVYNGIDINFFVPASNKRVEIDLLFVGRMSKTRASDGEFIDPKGVKTAIAVAEQMQRNLTITGNIEDQDFFNQLIAPHISAKIRIKGDVSSEYTQTQEDMRELYQGAKLLLNPINCEESFGLTMVEAMACGTPVVVYNRGSASEIVKDGVTGFVIDPDDENRPGKGSWIIKQKGILGLIEAVNKIGEIDSDACRKHAENFSIEKMVERYEDVYSRVLSRSQ